MSRATDAEILNRALNEAAILVTLDADFHTMLAVSGATGPSVIRLRRQGLDGLGVVEDVRTVLADFGEFLRQGAMVTIKVHKTTCCKLPVGQRGDPEEAH